MNLTKMMSISVPSIITCRSSYCSNLDVVYHVCYTLLCCNHEYITRTFVQVRMELMTLWFFEEPCDSDSYKLLENTMYMYEHLIIMCIMYTIRMYSSVAMATYTHLYKFRVQQNIQTDVCFLTQKGLCESPSC